MGAAEVTAFLNYLALSRRVAAGTQNQALAAILFVYRVVLEQPLPWLEKLDRAKRPARRPVVLSIEDTARLLARLEGIPRLVAELLYGAGLRVEEALSLRIKDLDLSRREIVVRSGKGAKDRVTMLPEKLTAPLTTHLARVRALHDRDLALGLGRAPLPYALAGKFPRPTASGPGRSSFRRWRRAPIRTPVQRFVTTFIRERFSAPYARRRRARASRSRLAATPCVTVSQRIYWSVATTSAPSKSSSATRTWRRR